MLQEGRNGAVRRLTASPGLDLGVAWTPDGSRLLFQSTRDGNREIYSMRADGSDPVNLTNDPGQDLLVDVAADGATIVFFSDRDILDHPVTRLPGHLYLMDAGGGEPRRVTDTPLTSTFAPDLAADGRHVLFARDFEGDVDLVVLDLETGSEARIRGTPGSEYGARYSPDGASIVFHAGIGDAGEARLVVANADGTGRREITRGGQHYDPHWSPDGRWIQFTGAPLGATSFDILMVAAEGGAVIELAATEADERYGAWAPR